MATPLTSVAGVSCPTNTLPVAGLELFESPDDAREPTIAHPRTTTLQVLEGIVYVIAGDDDWVLTPGDTATIEPELDYRRWNAGDEKARWVEVYCAP
jgi:quercetin dioxygenase-like cupin family protein